MNKKLKLTIFAILLGSITLCGNPEVYAWDSKKSPDVMDTHKTISVQALKIVKNDNKDLHNIQHNIKILEENLREFRKGAVAPDFGDLGSDRDYSLYQDHFFNPYTSNNFTANSPYPFYQIRETAESQTRNYVSQAVGKWRDGNYSKATFLLGKATHYFADLNEPHHASNITGGAGTAHTKFEEFAEKIKDQHKLETLGQDVVKEECDALKDKPLDEFLTNQSVKYAKKAYALSKKTNLSNTWDEWNAAAKESLENSQRSVATILYRFLEEVDNIDESYKEAPIGKFHVFISTADEKNAGTDDYVYFGMKLKNGKEVEFLCDLPGNDFVRNYKTAYEFEIKDKDFKWEDVSKVWIRKKKYAGDDWKVKDVEVYIKGQRAIKASINTWLSGNKTYEINVQ